MRFRFVSLIACAFLIGCHPFRTAIIRPPVPEKTYPPSGELIGNPSEPPMTPEGMALIVDGEGYDYRPAFGGGNSGIDIALGYDFSTVSKAVAMTDWHALPPPAPARLADTHPFTGRAAVAHLPDVHDITAPKPIGFDVFNSADIPRVDGQCRRAFPGFARLRPHARDAIRSLIYNRGNSLVGPSRTEMRELIPLIQTLDYEGIASCLRRMERVWRGTSIEKGMIRRREAELKLVLLP